MLFLCIKYKISNLENKAAKMLFSAKQVMEVIGPYDA
jgi:hypothetical protein